MPGTARIAITTVGVVVLGVATTLATISGAIDAVHWAHRTFGSLPLYLAGAFLAGVAITHGIHRGLAAPK